MKRFLALFFPLVFGVGSCIAQSSVTSGTVTDAGSVVWAFATVTATLSNPSGQTPVNIVSGLPVDTVQTTTTNSIGLFSVMVDRTDEIVPSGTTWNYVACSVTGVCATVNTTVTTATKTIIFPAIPAVSVAGLQIPNANQASQLATPVGPSFGSIAVIGNGLFIYDVTTMTWVPVQGASPTSSQIVALIAGQTIAPLAITGLSVPNAIAGTTIAPTLIQGSGSISITGGISGGAGHFTSAVVNGNLQVTGSTSALTAITATGGYTQSGTGVNTFTGPTNVTGIFNANATVSFTGTGTNGTTISQLTSNSLQAGTKIVNGNGMQVATGSLAACGAMVPGPTGCLITVTFPSTEPDTSYSVHGCMPQNTNQPVYAGNTNNFATNSFTLSVLAFASATVNSGTIACVVIHN